MRILFATCSAEHAERVLRSLLEERLVACGNLIPGVRSLYWWEGEICDDAEVVMLMETTAELAGPASQRLAEIHPYDVPKVVTLDPADCHPPYLEWLRSVTKP